MASRPAIIAGACGYGVWPANTVEAATHCLSVPVDGIEVDVHLSADGHVVAYHDYRLNPELTHRPGGAWIEPPGPLVRSLTLDQLRIYDVGRFRPGSKLADRYPSRQSIDGVRIPTLKDIIGTLKAGTDRSREIYVEIKTNPQDAKESSDPVALAEAVLSTVIGENYLGLTTIIAFDWSVLRWVSERNRRIRTAHISIPHDLAGNIIVNARGDSPWADGCDLRHYGDSAPRAISAHGGRTWSVYYRDITHVDVQEARDLGLSVAVWGVEGRPDIDTMIAVGVDSITVSGPDWGPPRAHGDVQT